MNRQTAALMSTTSMTFLLMNSWMPRLVNPERLT